MKSIFRCLAIKKTGKGDKMNGIVILDRFTGTSNKNHGKRLLEGRVFYQITLDDDDDYEDDEDEELEEEDNKKNKKSRKRHLF